MEQILIALAALFIASLLAIFLKRFGLPTTLGYIFTGMLIDLLFGISPDNSTLLHHIAETGIILLMFTIGLEFSFDELKILKKEIFLYGTFQLFASGTLFTLLALLFHLHLKAAIIVGFALALSSTAIVLKMLDESGDIHANYGKKALGILLLQDLAVIPLLLMIELFTKEASLWQLLAQTLLNMALFFALLLLLGKFVINRFLHYAVKTNNQEIFLLSIFFIILISASVSSIFGFSYSLGAFFAGMLLAESRYKYQIEADLAPFRDLLLGLFFFAIGSTLSLPTILSNIFSILFLAIGVMLLKFSTLYLFLQRFEIKRTAFKTALSLAQIGEFSLVLLLLAQQNRFIDESTTQILSAAIILTMIATPFLLKYIKSLADLFLEEPQREFIPKSTGLQNHIIVCGFGPLGKSMAQELKSRGFTYLIIEHDLFLYEEGLKMNEPIFFGNAAQRYVLENLFVKNASAIIITLHNIKKIRLIAQAVLDLAPHAHIVARVRDEEEAKILEDLDIKSLVITTKTLAKEMTRQLFYCHLQGESNSKTS